MDLKLDWVITERAKIKNVETPLTEIAKINGGWLIRSHFYIEDTYGTIHRSNSMVFIPDPSHVLFVNHDKDDA